ncbi:30S ribosomal protein S19e [Candidatus Pacearchaeota archaeon CG10_big_fil_rev_8_21_14_0_10_35_13]|nr:MAG: 30S ribosomal protein S19e [Candidatus Pacearchaeota archaeon CG10_big_fil_rev_8_21_14_0_10_35_13]
MAVYDIPGGEYNNLLAEELKNVLEFEAPEWSLYVKSGRSKDRPIMEPDFWQKRAASIMRQAYLRGVVGVSRLRTKYGSKKNRGRRPEKFMKSSGKIIRLILQQAEAAGLMEKSKTKKAGRSLTKKGRELMESIKLVNKEQ